MGFGHRVYKNYDPRATIIKEIADQVFEVTGRNPQLDIALELERIALEDEYFVSRKLYPNCRLLLGDYLQGAGNPDRHVPGDVRHRPDGRSGWPSGRKCSKTQSRQLLDHGKSIWARASGTSSRWQSASPDLHD